MVSEFLFEIIMRRHQLRSTMMTSNRPLEDWGKLIGDVPSAGAILDRFLSNAEVIEITGESYRMRGPKADSTSSGSSKQTKTGQTRKPGTSAESSEETT